MPTLSSSAVKTLATSFYRPQASPTMPTHYKKNKQEQCCTTFLSPSGESHHADSRQKKLSMNWITSFYRPQASPTMPTQ